MIYDYENKFIVDRDVIELDFDDGNWLRCGCHGKKITSPYPFNASHMKKHQRSQIHKQKMQASVSTTEPLVLLDISRCDNKECDVLRKELAKKRDECDKLKKQVNHYRSAMRDQDVELNKLRVDNHMLLFAQDDGAVHHCLSNADKRDKFDSG